MYKYLPILWTCAFFKIHTLYRKWKNTLQIECNNNEKKMRKTAYSRDTGSSNVYTVLQLLGWRTYDNFPQCTLDAAFCHWRKEALKFSKIFKYGVADTYWEMYLPIFILSKLCIFLFVCANRQKCKNALCLCIVGPCHVFFSKCEFSLGK